MYMNISFCGFCDAFRDMDRNDIFSYEAKQALFDYYENYEEETGEKIELDVIAICCDWSEATEEEIRQDFNIDKDDDLLDYLNWNTQYINLDNGNILYLAF